MDGKMERLDNKKEQIQIVPWAIMSCTVYGAFSIIFSLYISVGGQAVCWGYVNYLPYLEVVPSDMEKCLNARFGSSDLGSEKVK